MDLSSYGGGGGGGSSAAPVSSSATSGVAFAAADNSINQTLLVVIGVGALLALVAFLLKSKN
jgi:hypothetical protein